MANKGLNDIGDKEPGPRGGLIEKILASSFIETVLGPQIGGLGKGQGGKAQSGVQARLFWVKAFFAVMFIICGFKAVQVALFRPVDVSRIEAREAAQTANRADIIDRNGVVLATSLPAPSLYADPDQVWDANETADQLHQIFPEIPRATLYNRLMREGHFVWIKRRLTPTERQQVWDLGQPGLFFQDEPRRVYPNGRLAGHVLGAVNAEGKGYSGLEARLEQRLLTTPAPVRLSIDARVQNIVESALDTAARKFSAEGGSALVMDARTGEILASASWPFVDPINAGNSPDNVRLNRSFDALYEMGSTFKAFTIAAALEHHIVTPETRFDVSSTLMVGGEEIHDMHAHTGDLSVAEIIEASSNKGTARIALAMGTDILKQFFDILGLTRSVPADLNSARPLLPPRWTSLATATTSYGHGINVAPIAIIAAYSALANSGIYVAPTLLMRPESGPPPIGRRVISAETSATIVSLMRAVVVVGTAKSANVPGYEVAGKTGTAEKLINGAYSDHVNVSSFAAVFPASNPRYSILVLLDAPKSVGAGTTATATAAPAVAEIITRMAPVLGLAPVSSTAQSLQPQNLAPTAQ